MKNRNWISVLALVLACLPLHAADNPLMGKWTLNLAKSEFYPGPPPQYHINIYSPSGTNGVKYTSDRADAEGVATRIEFTANFDGKYYPMQGDDRGSLSLTRNGERVFFARYETGGKVTQIKAWIISDDGKTLMILSTGVLNGEPFNNIAVFDKQ